MVQTTAPIPNRTVWTLTGPQDATWSIWDHGEELCVPLVALTPTLP